MVTLAIYPRHDANITITDGINVKYFEMEKFAQKRYFSFNSEPKQFKEQVTDLLLDKVDPTSIDDLAYNWLDNERLNVLRELFPNIKTERKMRHHLSHAWSAYMFTEPKNCDIIASVDGGGDENDYFRLYEFTSEKIVELANIPINLGKPYRVIGLLSPDLYRDRNIGYRLDLALSGKKMSLAALGNVRPEFLKPVEEFYVNFMEYYDSKNDSVELNFKKLLSGLGFPNDKFLDRDISRDVLATSQHVFEKILSANLYPLIETGKYNRVIMVGGCGLNVTMNSKIINDYNIDVFVPPCPNDCGISLGVVKQIYPKIPILQQPYSHNVPLDVEELERVRSEFIFENVSLENIAKRLYDGEIIGTVVGNLEIGPRALGNRSYLASPFIKGMKNRVNSPEVKDREEWRPVAPMVTLGNTSIYFDSPQPSPYMTFAPLVRPMHRELLSEITHVDGSARIQTVAQSDGWIYSLLKEFGKLSKHEILMNTSFNAKGNPLINSYADAFKILRTTDLDAILVQNNQNQFELFSKNRRITYE